MSEALAVAPNNLSHSDREIPFLRVQAGGARLAGAARCILPVALRPFGVVPAFALRSTLMAMSRPSFNYVDSIEPWR
jgi:hypothetical protein